MSSSPARFAATILLLAAARCAASPPPVPPTVLSVRLQAAADVNPSPGGQGAPVAMRLYQLDTPLGFTDAEFYALYKSDAETLKTDLVKRQDLMLAPGESRMVTLQPSEQAHALGVFAAYRDPAAAHWHGVIEFPAHRTTIVTVSAGPAGVTVKTQAPPPLAGAS